MPDNDEPTPTTPEATETPLDEATPRQVGPALALVALALPKIAGVALCFANSLLIALAVAGTTVTLTATLLTIDAFRLGVIDRLDVPSAALRIRLIVHFGNRWLCGRPENQTAACVLAIPRKHKRLIMSDESLH